MAEDSERIVLTPAGYEQLQRDLEDAQMREQSLLEMTDTDLNAADLFNFEEGAQFDRITTRERLQERIGHLRYVLERAVVQEEDPDPHHVNIGDRVIVWDFERRRERAFDIVSSTEAVYGGLDAVDEDNENGPERVSASSPVGQAFMSRRVGEIVEVEVPDGKVRYSIRRMEGIPGVS